MGVRMRLVLVLLTVWMLISPADHIQASAVSKCHKKTAACGDFQPPSIEVGSYSCKMTTRCHHECQLVCPHQKDGRKMTLNVPAAKETFTCVAKSWTRRKDSIPAYCLATMSVREVQQNLHHINELNKLTSSLWGTSYIYLAMASYFERADVALPGFRHLMSELWEAEVRSARDLMSYINKRGGYLRLDDIHRPMSLDHLLMKSSSQSALTGLKIALNISREINHQALHLHSKSMNILYSDPHLKFYLQEGILSQKTEAIKKLADLIQQLAKYSPEDYDVGEYLLDLHIAGGHAYHLFE